jgi:hypothetical protein
MRRLVWIAAWTGVVFWSLFSLATYGLFDVVGSLLTGGARPPAPDTFTTGEPQNGEWLYPFVQIAKALGLSVIAATWFAVTAVILGAAFLVTRFLPSDPGPEPGPGQRGRMGQGPAIETTWVRHPDRRPDPAQAARDAVRRVTGRR